MKKEEKRLKINIKQYEDFFNRDIIENLERYVFAKVFYHWEIVWLTSGFLEITETLSADASDMRYNEIHKSFEF